MKLNKTLLAMLVAAPFLATATFATDFGDFGDVDTSNMGGKKEEPKKEESVETENPFDTKIDLGDKKSKEEKSEKIEKSVKTENPFDTTINLDEEEDSSSYASSEEVDPTIELNKEIENLKAALAKAKHERNLVVEELTKSHQEIEEKEKAELELVNVKDQLSKANTQLEQAKVGFKTIKEQVTNLSKFVNLALKNMGAKGGNDVISSIASGESSFEDYKSVFKKPVISKPTSVETPIIEDKNVEPSFKMPTRKKKELVETPIKTPTKTPTKNLTPNKNTTPSTYVPPKGGFGSDF